MNKHIDVLGILYIVFGALGLLLGGFLFVVIAGTGFISGEPEAMTVLGIIGTALGFLFVIFSVPEIIGGIFLLQRKSWARILVLILGFINLIDIPFGTALGIYTIWVLFKDETIAIFAQSDRVSAGVTTS
jgi:hypothetical protein